MRKQLFLPTLGLLTLVAGTALAQPSLTATAPARNSNTAPVSANVALTFSQPMSAATASGGTIKVFGNQFRGLRSLTSGGTFAGGTTPTITFDPNQDFRPGEKVLVTVTTAARALTSNQPIPRPQVLQFTTAAGAGPGTFATGAEVAVGPEPYGISAADVNNDGNVDLLAASSTSHVVTVHLGDGLGGFAGFAEIGVGFAPRRVVAADVNNDGNLDFLAASTGAADVAVRLGDGTGHFSGNTAVPVGNAPYDLAVTDMNGDGNLDFLTPNLLDNTVSVRLGDGTGAFTTVPDVAVGNQPFSVAAGDVNGDGLPDMVVSSVTDGQATVRLGNGFGGFGSTFLVPVAQFTTSLTLADVNTDGKLDLLAASENDVVSVRLGDGSGSFSGNTDVPVGALPYKLVVADFNGDGNLDLATANLLADENTITVRMGNGLGQFSGQDEYFATSLPAGLDAADVDNDGDLDLLVANSDGNVNTVSVRLNRNLPDLVVAAGATVDVVPQAYGSILVESGGTARLTGPTTVNGAFEVQPGGVFDTRCRPLRGSGQFALRPTARLLVCDPQGLYATGPAGAVRVKGLRDYSPAADYVYNGTAAQETGLGLPATVRDFTVDNPAGVMLSGHLTVQRRLVLAGAGDLRIWLFDLTLKSDAAGTAMVVNAGTGRVLNTNVGTARVQRWLDPTFAPGLGYHQLSSPMQNSPFAELATAGYQPVVNASYNTAANPGLVQPAPNIFGYDQSRFPASTNFSLGWYSPGNITETMTPGRGWSVYLSGGLTPDFAGVLNTGSVTVSGLIRTGSSLGSTSKPGWQLLGNPYPSPIDWDLVTVPAGMSKSISVWKSTGGTQGVYTIYTNGVGAPGTDLLGVGQGFFARVTSFGPVNFTFTNTCRVTNYASPAVYRGAAAAPATADEKRPLLSLQLRAAGATAADEAFVYFEKGASADLDEAFDGARPGRNVGVPTLAMPVGGEELAVNGLPLTALTAGATVPLLLAVPAAGTYELAVNHLLNLDGVTLTLVDAATRTRYNLQDRPTIRISASQAGELTGRFTLEIGARVAGTSKLESRTSNLQLWPNPAREQVRVAGLPAGQAVELLDALGRVVRTATVPADAELTLLLHDLRAGVYTVRAGAGTQRLVVE